MCVTPSHIFVQAGNGYDRIPVPCGHCWACKKNKINDIVGRCLCEAELSDWVLYMTLTYDDKKLTDPSQTSVIHQEDFQNFMKRLRRKFQTRYLVAGEYGEKKGRVHFHAMLFGKGKKPSWNTNNVITHIEEWPWGHVIIERTDSEQSIRYVAKYLTKARTKIKTKEGKIQTEWVSYSRIPIMGEEYVKQKAQQHANEKIFPSNFSYRPPNAANNRLYTLYGKARTVLLDEIFEHWPEALTVRKTDFMEKAVKRYQLEKHKQAWRKLTPNEQLPYLMLDQRQSKMVPEINPRFAAEVYWRLVEYHGIEKERHKLRQLEPKQYALIRNSFFRCIDTKPPQRPKTSDSETEFNRFSSSPGNPFRDGTPNWHDYRERHGDGPTKDRK